jgi:hypothetical protein
LDSDGDRFTDLTETVCGSNAASAASVPERIDTPGDDDGDTLVNEALPPGAGAFDCDGDGYIGSTETHVTTSDQDPCGSNGWPSDLMSGPWQPNTLNIQDLGSFLMPVRRLGTSAGDAAFDVRWDLMPGSTGGPTIDIADLAAMINGPSGYPPMFGGLRAYGKTCPYAP